MAERYGHTVFGLNDVKIAQWTAENTYGAEVDMYAAQSLEVTLDTVTADLPGDDHITESHSKVIGGTVRCRNGRFSLDAMAILTGETLDSTTSEDYDEMIFGESNRPYFGLCGRALDTGDGRDTHVFLPKIKVTGPIPIRMEYGAFVVPEMEAKAVYEGATNGVARVRKHAVATAISIPLA